MIPPAAPEPPRAAPEIAVQSVLAAPQPETLDIVLTAFSALGYAISARALLLCSILGAFVIAVMALNRADGWGLGVLVAYSLLVVIPLCLLEYRRREA